MDSFLEILRNGLGGVLRGGIGKTEKTEETEEKTQTQEPIVPKTPSFKYKTKNKIYPAIDEVGTPDPVYADLDSLKIDNDTKQRIWDRYEDTIFRIPDPTERQNFIFKLNDDQDFRRTFLNSLFELDRAEGPLPSPIQRMLKIMNRKSYGEGVERLV